MRTSRYSRIFTNWFGQSDESWLSNWDLNIRLYLDVRKDAIVVSSAAIQKGAQGSFVYVVGANNAAEVRPVQVDFTEGNVSVMSQGLNKGEQVVVDGADKLQAGAPVTPHQSSTKSAASAANSSPGSTP